MTRVLSADLAVPSGCELAEGPVWDPDRGLLRWVDILPGVVHAFDPATGAHTSFPVGDPVGAVGLTTSGGLMLAMVDGFAIHDGERLNWLPGFSTDRETVRFNDGKPDPWGNFCAGTMPWTAGGPDRTDDGLRGCLYRLTPAGTVTTMVTDVGLSNGLDWSGDRRSFYFADSTAGGVDVFGTDPDSGALGERQRLITVTEPGCVPDGLTLDSEGCLWLAVWGTGEVRRYTPAGTVDVVVRLPVRQVTCMAFGGADLRTLYITTGREDFTEADLLAEPHAGDIFCVDPGVTGRPAYRFAG
ncbi:MAG: SMP-30/gluconolactonase/LRE family protein [Streptosporangiaceae bacterium]|jgi:sugar lactone lactonase YvrE